jgi:proteic killer suppression protein
MQASQFDRAATRSSLLCITMPYIVLDAKRMTLYNNQVIKTLRDAETAKIYRRERSRKLPSDIQQVALRKLRMINNAININDLRIPPANRLEKLSGNRQGQYSIRINDHWRICFEWKNGDAFNVEITDYH